MLASSSRILHRRKTRSIQRAELEQCGPLCLDVYYCHIWLPGEGNITWLKCLCVNYRWVYLWKSKLLAGQVSIRIIVGAESPFLLIPKSRAKFSEWLLNSRVMQRSLWGCTEAKYTTWCNIANDRHSRKTKFRRFVLRRWKNENLKYSILDVPNNVSRVKHFTTDPCRQYFLTVDIRIYISCVHYYFLLSS